MEKLNNSFINLILNAAKNENKDLIIRELINNVPGDYNNEKAIHILTILADEFAFVTPADVDMEFIKKNLNLFMYKAEEYDIKDITLINVNNIEGEIYLEYCYKKKNENKDFVKTNTYISFINNPKILKKVLK